MKKYLLDTNICIYFIKGLFDLNKKIIEVGQENCFISEMTVAELKYGVENSKTPEKMRPVVEAFIPSLPLYQYITVWIFMQLKKLNCVEKV